MDALKLTYDESDICRSGVGAIAAGSRSVWASSLLFVGSTDVAMAETGTKVNLRRQDLQNLSLEPVMNSEPHFWA